MRHFWSELTTSKWSSGFIAVFSCLVLIRSNDTDLPSLAVCAVVIALLYGGYLAISRPASSAADVDAENANDQQQSSSNATQDVEVEDLVLSLAVPMLPILAIVLGVRMMVLHEQHVALVRAVLVGLVKALAWFFTLKATRHSSWSIASTIGTFALTSTRTPSSLRDHSPYHLHALSHLLASFLTLSQTIHLVPKGTTNPLQSRLWAFVLLPLLPFLLPPREAHPVDALARAATADFNALLARQSRTYTAAVAEYRRRYAIEPPPGFEGWYASTVALASPVIDEFDAIHEAIAPFLRMSGKEVREVMAEAGRKGEVDLWMCGFEGATGETRCSHPSREGGEKLQETFGRWLGGAKGKIPDAEFLVNHLDEPCVMLPVPGSEAARDEGVRVTDLSRRPVWDVVTSNCHPGDSKMQRRGVDANMHGLPFLMDTHADKDLCRHPQYEDMHGMVLSPTSFVLVEGPVPVLTTGTLSTMGDVLFPSPAYGDEAFVYNETSDVEWDKKQNKLYWAGSTTGAYAGDNDDGWKKYHRHRFVALAQGLESSGKQHWYLRERDGFFRRVASSFFNSYLYDVAFTAVIQCRFDACQAQSRYFDVRPRADKDAALRSRLVFDADGNGISGRFVKLLASRSAVLKQTLLREWHDERLAAWVHYVPVSQGLDKLPELVRWLTGTEEGRRRAKSVAEQGREWRRGR
ncbi:hypothetical protein VTI74DRAFT_10250 [Chaetomium olivicolor]